MVLCGSTELPRVYSRADWLLRASSTTLERPLSHVLWGLVQLRQQQVLPPSLPSILKVLGIQLYGLLKMMDKLS